MFVLTICTNKRRNANLSNRIRNADILQMLHIQVPPTPLTDNVYAVGSFTSFKLPTITNPEVSCPWYFVVFPQKPQIAQVYILFLLSAWRGIRFDDKIIYLAGFIYLYRCIVHYAVCLVTYIHNTQKHTHIHIYVCV